MARVADWTDLETTSNEMPAQVWGTCDTDLADRVGIRVELDNGSTASAVYSGVSGFWNSSSFSLEPDSATGFLASCTGFHFLYNDGATLPMAWTSCTMAFSNNFDLDYSESQGSHFRANTPGWVSARIQTYCDAGEPTGPNVVPTMPAYSMMLMMLGLALVALRRLRLKRQ